MVMQADPIYNCYNAVCEQLGAKPHTIYMTPKGSVFNQKKAVQLAQLDNIFLYAGIMKASISEFWTKLLMRKFLSETMF